MLALITDLIIFSTWVMGAFAFAIIALRIKSKLAGKCEDCHVKLLPIDAWFIEYKQNIKSQTHICPECGAIVGRKYKEDTHE